MLFRKTIKTPAETALSMLSGAIATIQGYAHNTQCQPSEKELHLLDIFTQELWKNYCTARHIQQKLHTRGHQTRIPHTLPNTLSHTLSSTGDTR